ncbi:MAG: glycoside hydrolase family 2 TIM barrel-domain containing protein [Anaerolineae bacterium]|nr:beta galactosidase jelly roll domain-containing protein [Candidatus Roseilinea sp.]MDW8449126.1 glycoside hydrolase family 2 TIM barrel-domain containing protein [Anaerolineae bacterium]
MTRHTLSLDGEWQFWIDPDKRLSPATLLPRAAFRINVPVPWQTHPDLRFYTGVGWYRRTFRLAPKMLGADRAVILRFDAADYFADVWVNGKKAGAHEGGYLPFELDVTRLVRPGNNVVVVRIDDSLDFFPEIPHGKQSWYGPISGLWQTVTVESRPRKHIVSLKITPRGEQVIARVTLSRKMSSRDRLRFEVFDPDGVRVAAHETNALAATLHVPSPRLWDIDAPHLYTLRATLTDTTDTTDTNDTTNATDTLTEVFGFRTIEARDGKLWLNGRPIYLRGALDQDYYPDGIYTPPSQDYIEHQFRLAKEMGLNCLRIHIKIGDPRYYKAADKVGLLIWTEMPNWQLLTEAAKRRARETFIGMVERDWNRPSIVIRSIINEAWGIDQFDPEHLRWMAETYDWLKAYDPSRLVVDNSACYGNFHVVSDIDDMHNYYAIPDHYQQWKAWVARVAQRPAWTYALHLPDAESRARFLQDHWRADWATPAPEVRRSGQEPIVISEFGNWGLPDIEKIEAHYGGEPWWFETGLEHGGGEVYPHGVRYRFKLFGLDRIFGSLSQLAEASQRQQMAAMKYEIEQMRRHPSIQGYVITEFTDLHWECNGLLDMLRNPKVYHPEIGQINADDVIVPEWERLAFHAGERVEVKLALSHYSRHDLNGSRLEWRLTGFPKVAGVSNDLSPAAFTVTDAGAIAFDAPNVKRGTRARLALQLVASDGAVAACSYLDLYFFPRVAAPAVRVHAPEHADALHALGYALVEDAAQADVVVVGKMTEVWREYLLRGGRVLWLAESDDAQQTWFKDIRVVSRAQAGLRGDWASSFSWIRRDAMFGDIPTDNVVDFAFADLTPEHVILGVHPFHWLRGVHAGIFVGWIHKNAALVAERHIGRGRMIACTFRLRDHLASHPVAAVMLRDMVARLANHYRLRNKM